MADGTATPSTAVVDGSSSPSDVKRPADEAARAKEADRAKRRRLLEKLKGAKDADELRKLMGKYAGGAKLEGADADLDQVLAAGPAEPLEPGQRPGWPKPSEVDEIETMLRDGLKSTGDFGVFVVGKAMNPRTPEAIIATAVATCLKEEPGEQLARAWAPLVALYAPKVLLTPHAQAVLGTAKGVAMIVASVQATMDLEIERLQAERKAQADKTVEPAK
jgi:hypothetical protein